MSFNNNNFDEGDEDLYDEIENLYEEEEYENEGGPYQNQGGDSGRTIDPSLLSQPDQSASGDFQPGL
jgi:hypothetical protein